MQGLSNLKLRPETDRQNILRDFLLYPITYIRLVGLLCSIIVFGCVADQLDEFVVTITTPIVFSTTIGCAYGGDSNCCNFAIAIGVLAFLLCLVFLMKDILYNVLDFSDNITLKKLFLIVDIAVNGVWAFMWFVAFIYTADKWRKTNSTYFTASVTNCANSGVAFSFFSTLLWIAIVVVNVILLIRLIRSPAHPGTSGYSSFPEPSGGVSPSTHQVGSTDQPYSPPEY